MLQHSRGGKMVTGLLATAVWAALLGSNCSVTLPDDGGVIDDDVVTIRLDNRGGSPVDPGLYAHPDSDIAFNQLIDDANYQSLEPPLQVDENGENSVELDYACDNIGTVSSYVAWLFINDSEYVESIDSPVLRQGVDFFCGDEITFIYEVDEDGFFRTLVRLNGVLIDFVEE